MRATRRALRIDRDRLDTDLVRDALRAARGRLLRIAGCVLFVVLVVVVAPHLPSQSPSGHWETPGPIVVVGVITGLTFGLSAVGLVLVYRANKIINFAHGEIGAFGAAGFGLAVVQWGVPYWVALPFAMLASASVAAAAEAGVVRRLRRAPRVMSVVATLGVAQFVVAFAFAINARASAGGTYPQPPGLPVFYVGSVRVTQAYSGMLLLSPLVIVALALFLKRSRYGLAIRSAAEGEELARMSGVYATRMSSMSWAIAGALSALAAILTQPTQGFTAAGSFGPGLLLRALACAAVARMTSIPIAFLAGIGLGVIQQLLLWNFTEGGVVQLVLFVFILIVLLFQRQLSWREEPRGSWAAVLAFRPLPEAVRSLPTMRRWDRLRVGGLVVLAAGAAGVPLVASNYAASRLTAVIAFAIVGISVHLATGLGGQLTLGPFAVASVGALVSYVMADQSGDSFTGVMYACLAGGVVSILIGLPAIRLRGLMLTVTTLAFALATPAWFLVQPWALGSGRSPRPPSILGVRLDSARSYYVFALLSLGVALVVARNVRRSGLGDVFIALRDNEANARAFAIHAIRTKLWLYFLSGAVAGLGGAVYGDGLSQAGVAAFPTSANLSVVTMTVVGGLSLRYGSTLGALFVVGLPAFVHMGAVASATTDFGLLVIVLYLPSGLGSLFEPLRDALVRRAIAKQPRPEALSTAGAAEPLRDASSPTIPATVRQRRGAALPSHSPILTVHHVSKHFGGVQAVRDVSMEIAAGETVGLIGPNGAGKTTTFELISGFLHPDAGVVRFNGSDISRLSPEARADRGLIRSFQDAALFPTMTVLEVVALALERTEPTTPLAGILGSGRAHDKRVARARELTAWMGLERYRDTRVQELSTGSRRIVEITCLVALEPRMLLLDEPSAGVAQKETEVLGELLLRLKSEFDLTLCVIEHDMPLIMGMSDRIIAMADGEVLAVGSPESIKQHPEVLRAYLGTDEDALGRSNTPARAQGTAKRSVQKGLATDTAAIGTIR